MKKSINEWCESCHANAKEKGFWDHIPGVTGVFEVEARTPEKLMLIVTELAEAMEAY